MPTKIYYEQDIPKGRLEGQRIAIIGYGAQGRAHALNLRDSGCDVVIGQRTGGAGWDAARNDRFSPCPIPEAVRSANLVALMLPDEKHGEVFEQEILPHAPSDFVVLTCHGFSFHYQLIPESSRYQRLLVAPKGQGQMVRGEFVLGGGVPCLVATDSTTYERTFPVGLAYAQAIGGARAGIIETTIAAETETDLFGEQAVLCGGLTALVQTGFDVLVEAGYQPELAYFECLHELKIIVDLLHAQGIAAMREVISTTAEFGDITRGPRVIDSHVRDSMRRLLDEIRSGEFAREFLAAQSRGGTQVAAENHRLQSAEIERVGQKLRQMMPWLKRAR